MSISIIMPAFNSDTTIALAIKSVLSQSFEDFELLVVDDGSTDSTQDIVKRFTLQDRRVLFFENKFSRGAAGARNTGLYHAKYRYLAFLDSDDFWHCEKLDRQMRTLIEEGAVFTYTDYFVVSDGSDGKPPHKLAVKSNFSAPNKIDFSRLLKTCDIGCSTVLIDRSFFGDFAFPIVGKEDYALWLTLFGSQPVRSCKTPGLLAFYRLGENSVSSKKYREVFRQYKCLRKFGRLSVFESFYCLVFYTLYGFIKYKKPRSLQNS